MQFLELKIPPPLLGLLTAVVMYLLAQSSGAQFVTGFFQYILMCVFAGLGFLIDIIAIISFQRAKTTILPFCPERSSVLVVSGIYRFSRNPMYLGLMMILAAWAIFLGVIGNLVLWLLCLLYLTEFQIKPEERILSGLFGDEYQHYLNTVRRWI